MTRNFSQNRTPQEFPVFARIGGLENDPKLLTKQGSSGVPCHRTMIGGLENDPKLLIQ